MFIDNIGFRIGMIIGKNKMGNISDLFLAYMEKVDIIVPHTDKLSVGKKIPKNRNRNMLKFVTDGLEMKNANIRITNSTTTNMTKQKIILLRMMILKGTGDEIKPPRVPASCSLINNFIIINIIKKIVINQS